MVPSPALGEEFCYLLDPEIQRLSKSKIHKAASKKGAKQIGIPLNEDWSNVPHLDLVVVASVAVSPHGVSYYSEFRYCKLNF